jgi:putative ABC transport system permease protein
MASSFDNRMHYVELSNAVGARAKIHFMDTPISVIRARLEERNAKLPRYNFLIDRGTLQGFLGLFELPSEHEGAEVYFEVFKIPILRGRTFTERDEIGPPVVIINQSLAKRFWPSSDPLHDQIIIGGESQSRQIIGVVGDVHDDFLNREPRINVYEPLATRVGTLEGTWAWVTRTRDTPLSLSSAIQNELREVSGGLPVARVRTMDEILSRSTAAEDFNALVLTIFGCSAMLLAAIGIYGLMAYSVAQRTQEIGIRLALGAESSHIRNMVVFQGLRPALVGVVCGLVAAFGLTRLIASFLFGVKPWDAFVFFVVPAILVGVALVAVWLPAMRASWVDPIDALRYD